MKSTEPYGFDAMFERVVITMSCSNPGFYERVGHMLDPELVKLEASKHALRAAHSFFKEHGRGPAKAMLVLQVLRGWMKEGKITLEAIRALSDLFDEAEDHGLPPVEQVVGVLVPELRQRIRDEAVQTGIEAFGQRRDLSKVIELEHKAQSLGVISAGHGMIIGDASWEEVEHMRDIPRMETGISELDTRLGGGLERGGLGIWIGGAGDGKSMALSHTASVNLQKSAFVAYATLELPVAEVMARVKAHISQVPINALKMGDTAVAKQLVAQRAKGKFVCETFTPLTTTFDDVANWVEREEAKHGRRVDLLVVDYGDKLGVRKARGAKEDESGYTTGRVVYEKMRIWAEHSKRFCWTASQGTRRKDRKKRLDLDDAADSMHKVRVGDLIITLNVQEGDNEEQRMIKLFTAKHRTGDSRFEVGPFPTAFDIGQLVPC